MSIEDELRSLLEASGDVSVGVLGPILFQVDDVEPALYQAMLNTEGGWEVKSVPDIPKSVLTLNGPSRLLKEFIRGTDEGVQAAEQGTLVVRLSTETATNLLESEELTFRGQVYSFRLNAGRDSGSESFVCGEIEEMAKSYIVFGTIPFVDLNRQHATAQELFDAFREYHLLRSVTNVLMHCYFSRSQMEFRTRVEQIHIFGRTVVLFRFIVGLES